MSTFRPLSRLFIRRYGTSIPRLSSFSPGPSPPRLPKEEQEIFERLQRQSTGAFSTPQTPPPSSSPPSQATTSSLREQKPQSPHTESFSADVNQKLGQAVLEEPALNARFEATGTGEELHPHVRRGAKPEFEGDTNPKTGEVGGPKNEPLRWGAQGDWSFNGRVTDF